MTRVSRSRRFELPCLEFSSDILGFWNMSEIRCWILMFQIMKAVELYQGETFGFSWDMLGSHKVGDGLRVDLDLVQLQLRQRQLWALLAISSSSSKATFGTTSRDCLFSKKELLVYSQGWFIWKPHLFSSTVIDIFVSFFALPLSLFPWLAFPSCILDQILVNTRKVLLLNLLLEYPEQRFLGLSLITSSLFGICKVFKTVVVGWFWDNQ